MNNLFDGAVFSLSSTKDFEDEELAKKIVNVLLSSPISVRPVSFDKREPTKRSISSSAQIVEALCDQASKSGPHSGSLILQLGKDCSYQIHWRKSDSPSFSFIGGHVMFNTISQAKDIAIDWLDVVKSLTEILNPSYGEVRSMTVRGWDAPLNLPLRLPDIPNISIYGKEYIGLFGKENIESAPFSEISKIGECYWLIATSLINEEVPDSKRHEIRCHFGEDAFMVNGRWKYGSGRAPTFDFSSSLYRE